MSEETGLVVSKLAVVLLAVRSISFTLYAVIWVRGYETMKNDNENLDTETWSSIS